MSGQFSGFSEDDIKKLKNGIHVNNNPITHTPVTKFKRNRQMIKRVINKNEPNLLNPSINTNTENIGNKSAKEIANNNFQSTTMPDTSSKSIQLLKGEDLDKFQEEQKRMEEENRRKKELLSKALADRAQKTTAEALKLQTIQEELQKLDSGLSNDVSILRNQIEVASIDFMQCQKRFERLEKDYLATQTMLEKKREMKDLLTKHLYTIIQQNEIRKSAKLVQLMDELNLNPTEINASDNKLTSVI